MKHSFLYGCVLYFPLGSQYSCRNGDGGMVLETNMNEIVTQIDAQNKLEKSEVRMESALVTEGSERDHKLCMVCSFHCLSFSITL